MLRWLRRGRKARPFPPPWRALLERRLPHLRFLTPEQRPLHERRVQRFLDEKKFYGCNGFEVTEEVRVLIAGLAGLLLLRPDARVYPDLRSVLVYPTAFWVRHEEPDEDGLVWEGEQLQLGESQDWGRVILSWEDVEAALAGDPVNVAVHEFAHQLDDENPGHEGAPRLPDYADWSRVMSAAWEDLERNGSPVLDEYALEGPSEFFSVATEAYFQSGRELQRAHRKLYTLLRDYYRIETAR